MIGIDLFDMDERIIINSLQKGIAIAEFTRKRLLENLNLDKAVTSDEDTMMLSLIEGIKAKISLLSDDEWKSLAAKLPFETAYEDNAEPPMMDGLVAVAV